MSRCEHVTKRGKDATHGSHGLFCCRRHARQRCGCTQNHVYPTPWITAAKKRRKS